MIEPLVDVSRWSLRRKRAEELRERWSFAAEVLAFYAAIADVQEAAFVAVFDNLPSPQSLSAYAAERVVPRIVETSIANGPPAMTDSVLGSFHEADFEGVIDSWLRGEELGAVERYLARAATGPILEALVANDAELPYNGPRDDCHCPRCGGAAQLSYFAPSREDLVTAHRFLECSRCATTWTFPRMTCASCGEAETARLKVFGEIGAAQADISGKLVKSAADGVASAHFPHLRIDGCATCSRYVLTIDLERDPRAIPIVDEIASVPLDLYAKERGMTKLVPNLMGF